MNLHLGVCGTVNFSASIRSLKYAKPTCCELTALASFACVINPRLKHSLIISVKTGSGLWLLPLTIASMSPDGRSSPRPML